MEGAGKAGCPMHPQPRVESKNTRVSHHGFTGSSGLPCAMVLTVSFVLSLVIGLCCHHRQHNAQALLPLDISVEMSGPHDFAVRSGRSSSQSAFASTASRPTFVTMANVPLSGETGGTLPVIWGNDQSRDLRRINTTGKSVESGKIVSTEQQLLRLPKINLSAAIASATVSRSEPCMNSQTSGSSSAIGDRPAAT
jgi:hypothetical protein